MKQKTVHTIICLLAFLQLSLTTKGQSKASSLIDSLDIISDYPIKIDGGCSYFSYKNTPINYRQYILVISSKKTAFIQYHKAFIYFQFSKRANTNNGYIDYYKNGANRMILKIDSLKKDGDYSFLVSGNFRIIGKNSNKLIAVNGRIDN